MAEQSDSSGPVHSIDNNNPVAEGIHNAGKPDGSNCLETSTDIWDAFDSLPGIITVG